MDSLRRRALVLNRLEEAGSRGRRAPWFRQNTEYTEILCEMKKSYEIDMCDGPLLSKILYFRPLMMSGILQLLFNAADIIVVGRFAGSSALAAVGSTSSLINLLINVFVGLSWALMSWWPNITAARGKRT